MIDAEAKKIRACLSRIAGQVQAVERMVDAGRDCIDLCISSPPCRPALGKAAEVVLRSHVQISVSDAI